MKKDELIGWSMVWCVCREEVGVGVGCKKFNILEPSVNIHYDVWIDNHTTSQMEFLVKVKRSTFEWIRGWVCFFCEAQKKVQPLCASKLVSLNHKTRCSG